MELETKPRTTLLESVLILVFLIGCLGSCIIIGHMPPHVPILMVFAFLCFWGKWKGYSWDEIHKGISEGISPGIVPLIIFMLIGVLVSSLIAAGTIPTIVVYGCEILCYEFPYMPCSWDYGRELIYYDFHNGYRADDHRHIDGDKT